MARRLDDLLLPARHHFQRQLDAEIAARDHDGIGKVDDVSSA
jgi:hypothetical protein